MAVQRINPGRELGEWRECPECGRHDYRFEHACQPKDLVERERKSVQALRACLQRHIDGYLPREDAIAAVRAYDDAKKAVFWRE